MNDRAAEAVVSVVKSLWNLRRRGILLVTDQLNFAMQFFFICTDLKCTNCKYCDSLSEDGLIAETAVK